MSELSPEAKARDMELAPTMSRCADSCRSAAFALTRPGLWGAQRPSARPRSAPSFLAAVCSALPFSAFARERRERGQNLMEKLRGIPRKRACKIRIHLV